MLNNIVGTAHTMFNRYTCSGQKINCGVKPCPSISPNENAIVKNEVAKTLSPASNQVSANSVVRF